MAEVLLKCPKCGEVRTVAGDALGRDSACPGCGRPAGFAGAWRDGGGRVVECPACGCRKLYTQRDFNRRLGIGILVAAALLMIPTKGISLLVAALLDVFLFRRLPSVSVCYFCEGIFRGFPRSPDHAPYDAHVSDLYWYRREAGWEAEGTGPVPAGTEVPPQVEELVRGAAVGERDARGARGGS